MNRTLTKILVFIITLVLAAAATKVGYNEAKKQDVSMPTSTSETSNTSIAETETTVSTTSQEVTSKATETTTTTTTARTTTKKSTTTTKKTATTSQTTKKTTTTTSTTKKKTTSAAASKNSSTYYSASYFRRMGVIYWGNYRWTWYSQKVLPGGGLRIPGRHVDDQGYVCDENDYICLASSTLSKGTILDTPFGKQGKIYDSGCPAGTVDVYVNW